jgi:hypothetical protein
MLDNEESHFELRTIPEIGDAEDEFFQKVWYGRHRNLAYKIRIGKHRIIPKAEYSFEKHGSQTCTSSEVWERALKGARRLEKKYGVENLGPWDDFDWGMINGKLSALRWVFGFEWDMLDT